MLDLAETARYCNQSTVSFRGFFSVYFIGRVIPQEAIFDGYFAVWFVGRVRVRRASCSVEIATHYVTMGGQE